MKFTDISAKYNSLRKTNANNFQTNYFLSPIEDECFTLENKNAFIFLSKEKDFYKLFYAFTCLDDFESLLSKLPSKNIYLEIIAKKTLPTDFQSVLDKYFEYKTTYQKLYKKLENSEVRSDILCQVDVNLVFDKIYSTFDVYFEHLMSKQELQKLADENKILTIYENEEMKSFLIYKTQGSKAYLNHIANYGSKENLISLWKIFYKALNYHNINYLDLWYNMQNKKAENMYHKENFQPLELYNFCYKKR